jgi:sugar lactone lactonase YvrE
MLAALAPAVYAQAVVFASAQSVLPVTGLSDPDGVAADSQGNIFIADSANNRVLKVAAGGGGQSVVGSGLNQPTGVAVDGAGDVFIADSGNNRVVEVAASGGAQSAIGSGLNGPTGVAVDGAGDVFIADSGNNRVVEVAAGGGAQSAIGSGLNIPTGVAVDAAGDVFIADFGNNRVVEAPAGGGLQSTVGNGLSQPFGVAVDAAGDVFISDTAHSRVIEVLAGGGAQSTIASGFQPYGVAVNAAGDVLIADDISHIVEVQTAAVNFGALNVCPAGQSGPAPCSQTLTLNYNVAADSVLGTPNVLTEGAANLDFTLAGGSTCTGSVGGGSQCLVAVAFTPRFAGGRKGAVQITDGSGNVLATTFLYGVGLGAQIAFGPGTQSTIGSGLSQPFGVAVDGAGDVFIADATNRQVVKVPSGGGTQSTVGSGLVQPTGVAVDGAGDVFIADAGNNQVVKVPAGGGAQSTLPATGLNSPWGVAVDGAGDVFIADLDNNRVVEVPAGGGAQSTVGSGLNQPQAVAVDAAGDVFIADTGNNRVLEVPAGGGAQSTVGGGLVIPSGVAVDAAGDVFIADTGNNRVVEVPAGGGAQSTLPATGFNNPLAVALDASGDVFIADPNNSRLVELQRSQAPTLAFASTPLGSTSSDSPQSVTVENIGNATLTAAALTVGPNFTQAFGTSALADCTGNSSLTPGATCNLSISFMPTAGGPLQSSASLTNNSLNGNPAIQSIALNGIGQLPATTTALTANTTTAPYGQSVLLTAAVAAAASGTPTGIVTFYNGGSLLGTGALNAGAVATLSTAALSVGSDLITATYTGNAAFSASSGSLTETITAIPPAVLSLSPAVSTGTTLTFTGVYSDSVGASDLATVRMLFNTSISAVGACYVYYYPVSNLLYLENDAGTAVSFGITPGSSAQVSNSQCTLKGTGSSTGVSGNNLTLNVALTFSSTFLGPKNVYLYASSNSGANSYWVQKGAWGMTQGPPTVVSLAPASGSGTAQTFTGVYADPNGIADLTVVRMLFNTTSNSGANACYVLYYPASNLLYLENDGGTGLSAGFTPGSASQASNSQCTLAGNASSIAISGDSLTLNIALTFSGTFLGQKNVYLLASSNLGPSTGWAQKGTWTPASLGAPTVASVTPNSGAGATQTFAAVYSDPNGTADLATARMLFNTSISAAGACYVYYYPVSNLLYLENDSGTAASAGVTPGSSAQVSNSQCTLTAAGSSTSISGNNLTLNIALTFSATYLGAKNVYLYASSEGGANSYWVQKGAWTP